MSYPVSKPIASVVSSVSTLRDDMTKDLLSAVYVDLEQKKRRANKIIISGLPVAADDRQGVQSFLQVEFDEISPHLQVTSTRRLGRQQSDRIQPLLATCSNVDDAQFILNNAMLRKSANSLVRGQVYINPDLTKAEASAAFEMRQRYSSECVGYLSDLLECIRLHYKMSCMNVITGDFNCPRINCVNCSVLLTKFTRCYLNLFWNVVSLRLLPLQLGYRMSLILC